MDVRVDEFEQGFVGDALEMSGRLGERSVAFPDESRVLKSKVLGHRVLDDAVDELLAVRLGDFLVPIDVGHAFDDVGVDRDRAVQQGFGYLVFDEGRLPFSGKVGSLLELARVAEDEFANLPVALAGELVLEVGQGPDGEISR